MIAVVTGMIATFPLGGVFWDYAQYLLGLERLGFDVYYFEDTGCWSFDPTNPASGEDCAYGSEFLAAGLAHLSPALRDRWHYRGADGQTFGLRGSDLSDLLRDADLFLNVSGGTLLRDEYRKCQRKIFIDTDPGWNHFSVFPREDKPAYLSQAYRGHDFFFTYAERMGQPGCPLPHFGIQWHTTRPPVLLELWSGADPGATWTTVMSWNNYPRPCVHHGVSYGAKEREFPRVERIPAFSPAQFEVAVVGEGAPRERWQKLGWSVVDGASVSKTPPAYREYICSSRGEFSVAKNVYVATRCGWFSCRSVCYLAAGLPVVLQDTGFSEVIPVGEGLLTFANQDEAVQAIATIEADYSRHQAAARRIAREHFDATRVLGDLLDRVGLG